MKYNATLTHGIMTTVIEANFKHEILLWISDVMTENSLKQVGDTYTYTNEIGVSLSVNFQIE